MKNPDVVNMLINGSFNGSTKLTIVYAKRVGCTEPPFPNSDSTESCARFGAADLSNP